MKLLIIGPQLSGKTTLVKYLRKHTDNFISEIDEEILQVNDGKWPEDHEYKNQVLVPNIYNKISKLEDAIFFANYFVPLSLLDQFKSSNFKVLMLKLSYEEMIKRNKQRMEQEGYEDATQWLMGQLENHAKIEELNLVDGILDATEPTQEIAKIILTKF